MTQSSPLTLKRRFAVTTQFLLFGFVLMLGVGFYTLQSLSDSIEALDREVLAPLGPLVHLKTLLEQAGASVAEDARAQTSGRRDRLLKIGEAIRASLDEISAADVERKDMQPVLEAVEQHWMVAKAIAEYLFNQHETVDPATYTRERTRFSDHIDSALKTMDEHIFKGLEQTQNDILYIKEVRKQKIAVFGAAFIVSAVILLVSVWKLYQFVDRPVQILNQDIALIRDGAYSHRLSLATRHDEFGMMAVNINALLEQLEANRSSLALHDMRDPVTGVYSKEEFRKRLREEGARYRRYGRSFSLIVLEVDQYQEVARALGQDAADVLLKYVAAAISGEIRPMDFLARLEASRFALILPETPKGGAMALAERIRADIAERNFTISQGHAVEVTVSQGIQAFPEDGEKEDELVEAAAAALDHVIARGGNAIG